MVEVGIITGSSPRGRGTPPRRVGRTARPRFIPARAGNTGLWSRARAASSVHPRAGGEHVSARRSTVTRSGSSPRGRGTRVRPVQRRARGRFIPARAGNTRTSRRLDARGTVHPRAGGEHCGCALSRGVGDGSSPRGRGTQRPRARLRLRPRFIPARAGNTRARLMRPGAITVHPRAGGEHRRH